ncbi:S1 family peptidase [Bdellovibrio sp. HCB2-146]|uniref:S1 family peptidase n=1 Tax=Bdellovibrio sp. HCB2-146 TaxID=3394362 RepID=UPI0039BD5749
MGRWILLVCILGLALGGCGRPQAGRLTSRLQNQSIIDGRPVKERESAASRSVVLVELLDLDNNRLGFCTGTLIEEHFVLTAAHCFDLSRIPQLRKFNILFVNALKEKSPAVTRKGTTYSLHSQFNSQSSIDHDIAVAMYQGSTPQGFAPIAYDTDSKANYSSRIVYVYGYGRTKDYTGQRGQDTWATIGELHRGVMLIDNNYNRFADRYLTQTASETFLCQGDSGGPQFYHEKGVLKLIGINSGVFGRKLANGQHSCKGMGQATKVAPFAPWIKKEVTAIKRKYWYTYEEPQEEAPRLPTEGFETTVSSDLEI